jgi:alpha-tubulin suppressor-like RCC1 family protein
MMKPIPFTLLMLGLLSCSVETSNLNISRQHVPEKVTSIAAGASHTCAVLEGGSLRCWGDNDNGYGKLGYPEFKSVGGHKFPDDLWGEIYRDLYVEPDPDTFEDPVIAPEDRVSVLDAGDVNINEVVLAVSAAAQHTCVLLQSGNVRCWGVGTAGRLGNGGTGTVQAVNSQDILLGEQALSISVGNANSCALLESKKVRCWGAGFFGALGHGNTSNIGDTTVNDIVNAGDINIGGDVKQIAVGVLSTCALLESGNVRCWGQGTFGKLGYGSTANIGASDPEDIVNAGDVNIGGAVKQIAAGGNYNCALLESGNVRCWGNGAHGKLGYGSTSNVGDTSPNDIINAGDVNVGGPVKQIAAGSDHTCALLETGNVRCWGRGTNGRLGYGNTSNVGDTGPNDIVNAGDVNVGGSVKQIAAGSHHTCALLESGRVRCWGDSSRGRLGQGDSGDIGSTSANDIVNAGDVQITE